MKKLGEVLNLYNFPTPRFVLAQCPNVSPDVAGKSKCLISLPKLGSILRLLDCEFR